MRTRIWFVLLAVPTLLLAQPAADLEELSRQSDALQARIAALPAAAKSMEMSQRAQKLRQEVTYLQVAARRGDQLSEQEIGRVQSELSDLSSELDRIESEEAEAELAQLERSVVDLELRFEGNRNPNIPRDFERDVDELRDQVTYLKVRAERARGGEAEPVRLDEVAEVQQQLDRLRGQLDAGGRFEEQGGSIEVPAGTRLLVRIDDYISSKTANRGDEFEATVVDPVVVGTRMAIPDGTVLHGVVSGVDRAGRMDRKARLFLDFDAVTVQDQRIALASSVISGEDDPNALEGKGFKGDTDKVIAGSAIGTIIGAILGGGKGALAGLIVGGTGSIIATKGEDVTLPPGTGLWVQLDEPVIVPGG